MKKLYLIVILILVSIPSHAQVTSPTARRIVGTSVAPTTCLYSVNAPSVVIYNGDLYLGGVGNTCLKVASGGGAGTVASVGLTGTANQITVTGATPITTSGSWALSLSPTIALGTDNSIAGTLTLANSAAAAHTIWGSGATTTNTILGFTVAPTTAHLVTCTVSGTVCTLTDGGAVSSGASLRTNTTPNASQAILDLTTSTVNAVGLTVTPAYSATGIEKFEITGASYSGNSTTATDLAAYTSYSLFGSGNAAKAWITPGGNGQCLMSGASSFATTTPSFQSCPLGGNLSATTPTANGLMYGLGSQALGVTAAGAADYIFMGNDAGTGSAPAFKAGPSGGTNGCAGTTDTPTYNTSTHSWGCHQITPGASATAVVHVPIYCPNPQYSANMGNAFWAVDPNVTNNPDFGYWGMVNNAALYSASTAAVVMCRVTIPHNVDATPGATIKLSFFATTTATANVRLALGDYSVSPTGSYNQAFTVETAQTVAIGAQWTRFVVSFTPSATIAADSVLMLEIERVSSNVGDTYTAILGFDHGELEITEDF